MSGDATLRFPEGFLWAVATATVQVDGAAAEGGKGESIWDRFASVPAHVEDRSTPAVTCDHYHRYRDDLALMASLGLQSYRFSIVRFQGQYSSDYAVQFACMVLVALPALLLYFVFSRRIMEGATAGAVKG